MKVALENTEGTVSSRDYPDTGRGDEVELHQFFGYALRRIWMVAVCVVVFLAVGIFYLWITPPVYEAVAMVEVPLEARQPVDVVDSESQDYRSDEVLRTIAKNLARISLFRRVMARGEIKEDKLLQASLKEPVDSYGPDQLAVILAGWTTVNLQKDTRLINVSVKHQSPVLAESLANAIVDEFIRERLEMQSGTSTSAFEFLLREAEKAREKLEKSEKSLLGLQEFQDAIALKEKIDAQEDVVLELSQRYRDKHPKLVQARGALRDLNSELREQFLPAQPAVNLDDELNLLQGRFNVLSREVEADRVLYEAVVSRLKQTDVSQNWELTTLQIVEPAFAPLKPKGPKKMVVLGASASLGGGMGVSLVFILCLMDRSLRTAPDAARAVQIPVLGVIPRDGRILSVKGLERARHRPIVELKKELGKRQRSGAASSPGGRGSGRRVEPLVVAMDAMGAAAEALRTVRAELAVKSSGEGPVSFLVTSALAGEGKSFVASNLAASFALEEGRKTLLIDGNLRNPVVATLLDADSSRGGLVEALEGEEEWPSLVVESGIPRLNLLLAGRITSNPAACLSGAAFSKLLEEVARDYDRIVVDTTDINSAADTLLLAPHVDQSVLVIRAAKTPRGEVLRARDLLVDMGRKPAGLVLNGASS